MQVNYFPSRFDPVCHADRFPIPPAVFNGKRDKVLFLFNCSPARNNTKFEYTCTDGALMGCFVRKNMLSLF